MIWFLNIATGGEYNLTAQGLFSLLVLELQIALLIGMIKITTKMYLCGTVSIFIMVYSHIF